MTSLRIIRLHIARETVMLSLFLLSGAFSALADKRVVDGVAALVNERVVTIGDVITVMQPVHRQLRARYKGGELSDKLKEAYVSALETLIARELVLDAYNEMERKIPEWVVDNRVNKIIHDNFDDDRLKLTSTLTADGLTYDEWKSEIRDQMIVASMRGVAVEEHVTISPLSVREYYDANKEKFQKPDQVKLRMIVLKKEAGGKHEKVRRDLINQIMGKARAGDDFGKLAQSVSEGSRAEDGGDWGWIEPRMLRGELVDEVAKLGAAGLSGIVETDKEYYILKIEGRKKATASSFEDVQSDLMQSLRKKKAGAMYRAWVERLKNKAYVRILDVELFQ